MPGNLRRHATARRCGPKQAARSPGTRAAVPGHLDGGRAAPLRRGRRVAAAAKRNRHALHAPSAPAAAEAPAAAAGIRLRCLDELCKLVVLGRPVGLRRPRAFGLFAAARHRRRKLAAQASPLGYRWGGVGS